MDDIPGDVVGEIVDILPDPRPLVLAARRFYAVYTAKPDVAFWENGQNSFYILPKHYPEVWAGCVEEIIRADNLNMFVWMVNRASGRHKFIRSCVGCIYKYDSVEIAAWVKKEFNTWVSCNYDPVPVRCLDVLGILPPDVVHDWKLYYKHYGKTPVLMNHIQQHIHSDHILDFIERKMITVKMLEPAPDVPGSRSFYYVPDGKDPVFMDIWTYSQLIVVEWFVRNFKPQITREILAAAATNRDAFVFVYLYGIAGIDAPDTVAAAHDNISSASWKIYIAGDKFIELDSFYAKFGLRLDPEDVRPVCRKTETLMYILKHYREGLVKNVWYFRYTPEIAAILKETGIEFRPRIDDSITSWDELYQILRLESMRNDRANIFVTMVRLLTGTNYKNSMTYIRALTKIGYGDVANDAVECVWRGNFCATN